MSAAADPRAGTGAPAGHPTAGGPVLAVSGLTVAVRGEDGEREVVSDLSFSLARGETLCIAGESGSGKSMTSLAVMRLLPRPAARIAAGSIMLGSTDLARFDERGMQAIRGNRIAMIFQEPMTSLNPVFRVGEQIAEGYRLHKKASKAEAAQRAVEMLNLVGIPNPVARAQSYPHELSGGMRQRVMIAMALACDPDILFADEPTTALDVTIQAQILDLMRTLQAEKGSGVLLITHDLGVVAETAQRVAVMYAGQVVEEAPVDELYKHPAHPYTQGLLASVPRLGVKRVLAPIPGMVPGIFDLPQGCRFRPRCVHAFARCEEAPPLFETAPERTARCWLCESSRGVTA